MPYVIIVEDDEGLLEAMAAVLAAAGHRVRACRSGRAALDELANGVPDLIVAGVVMPEMSGLQLLEVIHRRPGWGAVPFVFVGAPDSPETEGPMAALGAAAWLRHPFDGQALVEAVAGRLRRAAEGRGAESRRAYLTTIEMLADVIEARDEHTREHTGRVRRMAVRVGEALGWGARRLEVLSLAALLHDIGKVAVPDAVLHKPGALTGEEWAVMRRHPVVGAEILGRMDGLASAAPAVRAHHERWDGRGYPDGLSGESIPLEARIVALADAYDAITSDRPYRQARPPHAAVAELERERGKQFDPQLVPVFLETAAWGGAASAL